MSKIIVAYLYNPDQKILNLIIEMINSENNINLEPQIDDLSWLKYHNSDIVLKLDCFMNKNTLDLMDACLKNGIKFKYNAAMIHDASKDNKIDVIKKLLILNKNHKTSFPVKCSSATINHALKNNLIDVLDLWKNSGFELEYDAIAIAQTIKNKSWDALQWSLDNLKIKYYPKIISNLLINGDSEILSKWVDYFKNKRFSLYCDPIAIDYVMEKGTIDTLNYWKNNLPVYYNYDAISCAIMNDRDDNVEWWINSGFKIHMTKNASRKMKLKKNLICEYLSITNHLLTI